ncbi:MAG: molecular chaperone HscC [Clostridium sp.]|nr:molecular chaperone HscC [Clostridium sp.]MCM1171356.1 molecular chaperone HscC [Clostridium sp.]MCM1208404.1 molecular chaperone HscC [Ruminococcus sp.]
MIVGIDLGTTNSLIAYFDKDEAKVIPNKLGEMLTPSVVSVDDEGVVYVGKTARERGMTNPSQTASVFKRSMGTGKKFMLGEREFTAEELSSLVIKSLKEDAEAFFGHEVTEAVISVPAYFNDAQRKATKKAGEMAGFVVERIVSEPTAAAIAYGLNKKNADTKFLVFDLGGGTFDVSILELYQNIMEVRAVAGDNYLGGEDFTEVLEQMFFREKEIDQDELDAKTLAHIRKQAELCKLGFEESRTSVFKCRIGEEKYEYEINIDDYEKSCQLLLGKIKKPIERSLKDAQIKLADIEEVILVGGATKLSIVRKFVSRLFGRLPNTSINPDEVVAVGAATQAAMKERDEAVKEIILTDVCPFTLGTDIVVTRSGGYKENGHYLPIIERNTVIPVSRTERLYTASDNQSHILVKILQGESRYARNNVYLGELEVPVPIGPAGKEAVDVTYTYDVNAILEVEVKVLSTKISKRVVIKNEDTDMSDEEIAARLESLASLKIHPREQEENKLLLLRGDRMYEEATGDTRHIIELQMNAFEEILDKQDKLKIESARKEFKEFLDSIEEDII